jgi:cytochrome c biogenesis protein CcdA
LRAKVEAVQATVAATSAATAVAPTPEPKPIYAAYFYKEGCQECERAQYDLRLMQQRYPQLQVASYSATSEALMLEWLGERYGVPEKQRLTSPAFFLGQNYLLGRDVNLSHMEALVQQYAATGAGKTWEGWEAEKAQAEGVMLARYRSFGLLTVAAAGLVDGVNPCAFATLLFLISFLAVTGRAKRQILATGIAFTAGVFGTYMLLGLGLYRMVSLLTRFAIVAKVLYGLTAAAALVLAGLSLYDFYQARRGAPSAMALRLPARLRRWVNRTIRQGVRPGTAAVAASLVGVVVSSVELVCTGQVYLPTIMFVASRPELRVSALGALTLYNIAFITPLVVVFAFATYGSGSERLHGFLGRHTAVIKLLTALVLLGLGAWLIALIL